MFYIVCRRVRARTVGFKFALVAARGRAYFDTSPLAWPALFAATGIYGQQMRRRAREDIAYASRMLSMRSAAVSPSPTAAPLAHRQRVQAARNCNGGLPCTKGISPASCTAACGNRLGALVLDNYKLFDMYVHSVTGDHMAV